MPQATYNFHHFNQQNKHFQEPEIQAQANLNERPPRFAARLNEFHNYTHYYNSSVEILKRTILQ